MEGGWGRKNLFEVIFFYDKTTAFVGHRRRIVRGINKAATFHHHSWIVLAGSAAADAASPSMSFQLRRFGFILDFSFMVS